MIRVKMRSSNNIPVSMYIGKSEKYPSFSGPYEATPKVNEQVFQTKNTSMEEYTDDGYSRTYNNSRSRDMMYDGGYSNRRGRYRDSERDGVMGELNEMMNKANSDIERQTIAKIMDRMR